MNQNFWDDLQIKSCEYFQNTSKFRREYLDNHKEVEVEYNLNVDDILNKINKSGIDSLTEKEKDFLNNKKN